MMLYDGAIDIDIDVDIDIELLPPIFLNSQWSFNDF